ncbi:MAG: hypothetical protein Q9219_004646 [cf. Caloplaca sp. 3 TL-2023]
MSSPPHPLFHFGMAGWWKIHGVETAYYRPTKPQKDVWPPNYWKVVLETASDDPQHPKSEHAFVDFRRFARIRLVDCPADDMRRVSPLKENGPDPVIDKEVLTEEWLVQKLQSKHIPVKALLLDQANISGIGNWVGDELLLDAKIHPEQYSNTLTPAQMKQLHKSIHYVCSTAVELLAESDRFPEHWLFKHRWGKGKKDDPQRLPNGEKITFLKVGGRTSAIIPSRQKKTGAVAADVKDDDDNDDEAEEEEQEEQEEQETQKPKPTKGKASKRKKEAADEDNEEIQNSTPTRGKPTKKKEPATDEATKEKAKPEPPKKSKGKAPPKQEGTNDKPTPPPPKPSRTKRPAPKAEEPNNNNDNEDDNPPPPSKKPKRTPQSNKINGASKSSKATKPATTKPDIEKTESSPPQHRRRSARVSSGAA